MIKDRVLPDPDKALGRIVDNSKQLLNMVDSILNATKIEAGVISVASQEVCLNEFVNELRSAYDFPFGKEVGLVWNFPAELSTVKTDRGKLRHIVQNLINNAIKFTDRGSVTVSAKYLQERRRVEFKVADTGTGIPKDKSLLSLICSVKFIALRTEFMAV
jgi:signal transduction histidine kinase